MIISRVTLAGAVMPDKANVTLWVVVEMEGELEVRLEPSLPLTVPCAVIWHQPPQLVVRAASAVTSMTSCVAFVQLVGRKLPSIATTWKPLVAPVTLISIEVLPVTTPVVLVEMVETWEPYTLPSQLPL